MSERGGFGFKDYGLPKDELRKYTITGDVYTQATNIEDEKNGLIDFETGELKVPAVLSKSKQGNACRMFPVKFYLLM